jgi:hypothetical protein
MNRILKVRRHVGMWYYTIHRYIDNTKECIYVDNIGT